MATQSTTLWNQFKGDLGEGPYREKGHRKDLYTSVFSKEGDDAGASGDIREDVSGSTTKPLVQNSADIPGNGDRTAFYRRKRERLWDLNEKLITVTRSRADLELLLRRKLEHNAAMSKLRYLQLKLHRLQKEVIRREQLLQSKNDANQQKKWKLYLRSKFLLSSIDQLHTQSPKDKAYASRSLGLNQREKYTKQSLTEELSQLNRLQLGYQAGAIKELFSIFPIGSSYYSDFSQFTIADLNIIKCSESKNFNTKSYKSLLEFATSSGYLMYCIGIVAHLLDLPVFHASPYIDESNAICVPGFGVSFSMIWNARYVIGNDKPNSMSALPLWHQRLALYQVTNFMHRESHESQLYVHEECELFEGLELLERSVHCIFQAALHKFNIDDETVDDLSKHSAGGVLMELFAAVLRRSQIEDAEQDCEEEIRAVTRASSARMQSGYASDYAHDYANDYENFICAYRKASPQKPSIFKSKPRCLLPKSLSTFIEAQRHTQVDADHATITYNLQ